MAKMLSQVATVIRGSVGGITYTANQFQPIIQRSRVSPTNPSTQAQTAVRSAFSTAETAWEGLTDAQRGAWEDYADTLTFVGPCGSYSVPGRQVFLANITTALYLTNRGVLTGTVGYTAPTVSGWLGIDSLNTIAPGTGETGFQVTCQNLGDEDYFVYAFRSMAFNPSRTRYKGKIATASLQSTELTAPSSAALPFYGLTAARRYFAKVRAISSSAPYRLSEVFWLNAIAVATP